MYGKYKAYIQDNLKIKSYYGILSNFLKSFANLVKNIPLANKIFKDQMLEKINH